MGQISPAPNSNLPPEMQPVYSATAANPNLPPSIANDPTKSVEVVASSSRLTWRDWLSILAIVISVLAIAEGKG